MKKPWGGRFAEATDTLVEEFTESITYDCRLYSDDIRGSIAHARMLAARGIISRKDATAIERGLKRIEDEIERGAFAFRIEDEDIHMAIEKRLREIVGDAAGKLHTARSRNDQVALDLRLYLKRRTAYMILLLEDLQRVFVAKAKEYRGVIAPGYTHLQRAQPVFLSHYLLSWVEMWERDKGRLADCWARMNLSPLGSGAMSGTTYPLDREMVAAELGFEGVTGNSMDAVGDRDFAIEFLATASIVMMHLSRLAEDMILWNSTEFGFVALPDGFCTGSSIMPQKKNPDVLELTRGRTGRVYGSLVALLTIMKGLPMTYNRDMQEDKEQVFDAVDTVTSCLKVLAPMFEKAGFRRERLEREAAGGYSLATEIADYLVRRGVPFRDAHEITGNVVAFCEKKGVGLDGIALKEYRKFSPLFNDDIFTAVTPATAVGAREITGGTGADQVARRIRQWEKRLGRR